MFTSAARRFQAGSLGLVVALALTACSNQQAMPGGNLPPPDVSIVAQKEPPAPKAEAVPPPPQGPAEYFIWEPGHWHWNGYEYIWIAGRYIERPYRSSVWVHGGWTYNGNLTWTWTPGHWS
jgi:YXWGXW repeat-containing protein